MSDLNKNKLSDEALEDVIGGVYRTVHNDTVGYANIRHQPGLGGKVAATVDNGTQLFVTGETVKKDGYVWYKVTLASGSDEAWIAGSLIGF